MELKKVLLVEISMNLDIIIMIIIIIITSFYMHACLEELLLKAVNSANKS